jgi:peptide deformylase
MAVRDVLVNGDPRLRQTSRAVPPSQFGDRALLALVQDLRDTMAARDGAGLAAPQIGVPLQVVIFGISHNPRYPQAPPIPETVLVNPEITPLGPELESGEEGCLSVPGLRAAVPRWRRVRYAAFSPSGEWLVREVEGFHARVAQHECDHLAGILFPDRLR